MLTNSLSRRWTVLLTAGCSCLLLLLAACAAVPYTGRKQMVLINWQTELQLGADAYKEIISSEKEVEKSANAKFVADTGRRLAHRTPQRFRGLDWQFKLLGGETINAFCLPGGKVAVYEGILPMMKTEGGMAAVVGHEIGHAIARHGAERISGTLLLQLGLSMADLTLSNSKFHGEIMAGLGLGAMVGVVLPFSRANELEADYLGGIFMAKAGYDPRESVNVWKRMRQAGGDNPFPFFSTHPTNSKRIERLEEEMPGFQKYYKREKRQRGVGKKLSL